MVAANYPIRPHGGTLVQRWTAVEHFAEAMADARNLRQLQIDSCAEADLELIAVGAYSPLNGFMNRDDYEAVLENMRLDSGLLWTLPITLPVDAEAAAAVKLGETVALVGGDRRILATLVVEDRFRFSKGREALHVYGTRDPAHPGVHALYRRCDVALAGPITMLQRPAHAWRQRILDPNDVRAAVRGFGWRTVVGFQTRNPLHRAHEYLHKCALELHDGLLLHPLVGPTKDDDVPADVRVRAYDLIVKSYYPAGRVLLALFPAPMRYAGPREAVFHAIVRQNYGCTHFIVGRNHAGVGDYYGPWDAQRLFEQLPAGAIDIVPLFFADAFYCQDCGGMATRRTCPHPEQAHRSLSGTAVRALLAAGRPLPPEYTRPEVGELLLAHARGLGESGA